MSEIYSEPKEPLEIPQELIEICRRVEALATLEEKHAFRSNSENARPVLNWYRERVRTKFLSRVEVTPKLKKILSEMYDDRELPADLLAHMQEILSSVKLNSEEFKKLEEVLSTIREDIRAMTSPLKKITESDYIPSHVLVGFDYAIQMAMMMKNTQLLESDN